jgi:protein-tyrosine phosphatase
MKVNYSSNIYGKWLLVNISGGIAGEINDIDTNTDRHILEFNSNNSITYFYNDSLVSNKSFSIKKRESIYHAEEIDFIVFENEESPEAITYLSKDTLEISDNFYDGYTRVYIKINK